VPSRPHFTTAFQYLGDVLVTFESEAVSINKEFGEGKVDAIFTLHQCWLKTRSPLSNTKKGTADLAKRA
jgi:sulfate transport system substrate-binding protein